MITSRSTFLLRIQLAGWLIYCVVAFMFNLESYGKRIVLPLTLVSAVIYAIVIYSNAFFLMPALYRKGKKKMYLAIALAGVCTFTYIRIMLNKVIYEYCLGHSITVKTTSYYTGALYILVVFLIGFMLHYMMDYFRLFEQQEAIKTKQAQAELDLLKSQVQPHFLYNTLNNIYTTAYGEAPATAALIEKLSRIMRYFTDDARKEAVTLQTEIQFIRDYLEMEAMRLRYPVQATLHIAPGIEHYCIPPMLMVPLIENVFKHGINKREAGNYIEIKLYVENSLVHFNVVNKSHTHTATQRAAQGLKNLRARLKLSFGDDFYFEAKKINDRFSATLNIPVQ